MVEPITIEELRREQGAEEARRRAEYGVVYIIRALGTNSAKVGFTRWEPERRLRALQTGCPHRLELVASWPGTRAAEEFIHGMLTRFQLRAQPELEGHEWFLFPDWNVWRDFEADDAAEVGMFLANFYVESRGGWAGVFTAIKERALDRG